MVVHCELWVVVCTDVEWRLEVLQLIEPLVEFCMMHGAEIWHRNACMVQRFGMDLTLELSEYVQLHVCYIV